MSSPAIAAARPLVFGHRGGAALAPENTIAAFDRGLALGADGLECDVRLSQDGVVMVHHDPTLDRTTDASGPIDARTADELARVDAGFRFADAGSYPWRGRGLGVPTLGEILRRYPETRLIIELKLQREELARATLDEIRAAGATDRVCVGSFDRRGLAAVRTAEPRVATGASREETRWALYRSRIGWPAFGAPYQALQVPERQGRTSIVSRRFVRVAHRAGLVVHVWTVDAPEDIRRLLDWGVDGIISDRPDVAAATVKEWVQNVERRKAPFLAVF